MMGEPGLGQPRRRRSTRARVAWRGPLHDAHLRDGGDVTSAAAIPEVIVVPVRSTRSRTFRLVYLDPCAHCGLRHFHGGGNGDVPYFGSRLSHCRAGDTMIELVTPDWIDADFVAAFARAYRRGDLFCGRTGS